jgi:hypothetical protein
LGDFHFTVPATAILGTAAAIIGYLMKKFIEEKLAEIRARRQAFISHIDLCNQKNIEFDRLKNEVANIHRRIDEEQKMTRWMGDCLMIIGAKMNVDLPERP